MDLPQINDIVILTALSVVVVLLFHRLKVSPIVGFLVTGVVAGPYGLGLVGGVHDVEVLAEVGVIFLLFTIGIEFSLRNLMHIRRAVLGGGSLQVGITILLAALAFMLIEGGQLAQAAFVGFLTALSSTAIVMKILQERGEVDSPHGTTALGILIFQDVAVVPMLLLAPILAGTAGPLAESLIGLLVRGVGVLAVVAFGARWVLPRLLYQVARTQSRELFLLVIIGVCFGVAWLTSAAGLSLALGAFLAGLVISESEYSHQALGGVLPLRDVFTSLFFISIGMLLDLGFVAQHPVEVALVSLGVLVLKAATGGLAAVLLGYAVRTALLVGLALSQIGEFSFVLARVGLTNGLLSPDTYQMAIAISVLSMAATPAMIAVAPRLAEAAARLPLPRRLASGLHASPEFGETGLRDHLIIVGFGVNGRNVSRAARAAGIPYVVVEMNPDTAHADLATGEPIICGDAAHDTVLEHANIAQARTVVVAVHDPAATRRITALARRLNPRVHIIVRTRFLRELQALSELGADEIIPEEFETSLEIFTRVLTHYLVPREDIDRLVAEVRGESYQVLRSVSPEAPFFADFRLQLPEVDVTALRVHAGSPLADHTLLELRLRQRYGVNVLAIVRDGERIPNPHGSDRVLAGDVLFALGEPGGLAEVAMLLDPGVEVQPDALAVSHGGPEYAAEPEAHLPSLQTGADSDG